MLRLCMILVKIATPDSILQKSGKLTAAEYEIMKQHAATGGDIILQTFYNLDDADFRQIAYEVARFHHEKFNEKATQTDWQGSRSASRKNHGNRRCI